MNKCFKFIKKSVLKYCRPFIFLIIVAILVKFINDMNKNCANPDTEIAFFALMVSVLALFQDMIKNFIFRPILIIDDIIVVNGSNDVNQEKYPGKYFNIKIKNMGFSAAENISIKIRDKENKEWLRLLRPFYGKTDDSKIYLSRQSKNEEEFFNFGRIFEKDKYINNKESEKVEVYKDVFDISCYPKTNNQKLKLEKDKKHSYYLEVISDNTNPKSYRIDVNNEGFDEVECNIIEL